MGLSKDAARLKLRENPLSPHNISAWMQQQQPTATKASRGSGESTCLDHANVEVQRLSWSFFSRRGSFFVPDRDPPAAPGSGARSSRQRGGGFGAGAGFAICFVRGFFLP